MTRRENENGNGDRGERAPGEHQRKIDRMDAENVDVAERDNGGLERDA